MNSIRKTLPEGTSIEVWFQDEARVGQKGTLTRRWAPCGSRPRVCRDQRFKSAYIFGAVCPERDTGAAIVMSKVNTEVMNIFLQEVSLTVTAGAHAALLIDGAGWHVSEELVVPANITLIRLPPYSPELNAIEKLWQYMRDNILSHRLFADLDAIIHACCNAWKNILGERGRIRSTCGFQWAAQVEN